MLLTTSWLGKLRNYSRAPRFMMMYAAAEMYYVGPLSCLGADHSARLSLQCVLCDIAEAGR